MAGRASNLKIQHDLPSSVEIRQVNQRKCSVLQRLSSMNKDHLRLIYILQCHKFGLDVLQGSVLIACLQTYALHFENRPGVVQIQCYLWRLISQSIQIHEDVLPCL